MKLEMQISPEICIRLLTNVLVMYYYVVVFCNISIFNFREFGRPWGHWKWHPGFAIAVQNHSIRAGEAGRSASAIVA